MFQSQSPRMHVNAVNSLLERIELTFILDEVDQIIGTN
jgi:hypothetical protein